MLKSKPFENTIPGSYSLLLLPEDIVRPFLERKIERVKVKASFESREIEFQDAIQKRSANHYIMFGKRYQKELGVFPNDYFQLQFFEVDSKYGL